VVGLDYNVLKLRVLRLLSKIGPTDSSSLANSIAEGGARLDIHALRMALMRYYKQGLLRRERSGGRFKYALTERGIQRLRWLEEQLARVS
jgi:DNA-binding transcriptional regulator PaaX